MNSQEAFKLGFIHRCHEEGLTADEMIERAEKIASALEKTANTGNIAQTLLSNLGAGGGMSKLLGVGAFAAPAAVGFGLGALARKLQGNYIDPEDVKNQELINTYKALAQRAKSSSPGS